MTITPQRLYQGQPGTTEATLYTIPPNTNAIIKEVILSNTTSGAQPVSLSFVPSGAVAGVANRIVVSKQIPGNDLVILALSTPMAAGDFISGLQGTAGDITVTISGVLITTP